VTLSEELCRKYLSHLHRSECTNLPNYSECIGCAGGSAAEAKIVRVPLFQLHSHQISHRLDIDSQPADSSHSHPLPATKQRIRNAAAIALGARSAALPAATGSCSVLSQSFANSYSAGASLYRGNGHLFNLFNKLKPRLGAAPKP
jgi:hypothetical protein